MSLSLVDILCCDNEADPPTGEHSLHHNKNLLDANLAKNVYGIDKVKFFRAETSMKYTPKNILAKFIDLTVE